MKYRICTVIGARPQFIKAAAIERALAARFVEQVEHLIIHSGQHYDDNMSSVFFKELGIPSPTINLETGSGSHGFQTAEALRRTAEVLAVEKPGLVIVYGDTNTTLAGALAAAKLGIPVAHIEAGLRSFDKNMPEEINRVLTDHLSTLLFAPTQTGMDNLVREGFSSGKAKISPAGKPAIYLSGDVMYDNVRYFGSLANKSEEFIARHSLPEKDFILCTIHRERNTSHPAQLSAIFGILDTLSRKYAIDFIFPLHPRTRKSMRENLAAPLLERVISNSRIHLVPPASYFEMLSLEQKCRMVITDSGGVQKEAFFYGKPCLIMREESEWEEIIASGAAAKVGTDPERAEAALVHFLENPPVNFPAVFGDGNAAGLIVQEILNFLHTGLQVSK